MSFVQRKLVKSFNQTRDIFDKFVYKPDNGDRLVDMLEAGYFDLSRYRTDPDWQGAIIEAFDAQGKQAALLIAGDMTAATIIPNYSTQYDLNKIEFISDPEQLPDPSGGTIALAQGKTYWLLGDIDLNGYSITTQLGSCIIGGDSDNASLTSTGIGSTYMIQADYPLPMRHVTLKDVENAVGVNLTGSAPDPNIALDWTGVNFVGCTVNLRCGDIGNFLYDKGAVLGSGSFKFFGELGTVALNSSLFVSDGSAYSVISVESTATINRRFRSIYSAYVITGSSEGFNVDASATIPTASFILDTCNFSGGGTYISGMNATDNRALFVNNVGIVNGLDTSHYYMNNNATATVISATSTPVKVAGATTSASVTSKFTNTNNRATYIGVLGKFFKVTATGALTAGNNQQIRIQIAKNGTILPESAITATTNAGGRLEGITVQTLVQLVSGDYIEIFVANNTATTNITVTDLNVIIE